MILKQGITLLQEQWPVQIHSSGNASKKDHKQFCFLLISFKKNRGYFGLSEIKVLINGSHSEIFSDCSDCDQLIPFFDFSGQLTDEKIIWELV